MTTGSPPSDTASRPGGRWAVRLGLAALAFASTSSGFGNRYTQDDLPLILRNETVHTLSAPNRFFTRPYWQPPFPPALYRPLATGALAVQWQAGGGSPVIYRWGSAVLLAGCTIAVFELAALLMPVLAAAATAALFAVHPVHVESTALGVNQGEIAVALLLSLAVAGYIRARRRGDLAPGPTAGILGLFATAALFKENGLVLPGLLVMTELFLIRDPRPWGEKVRRLRPFYLGTVLVIAAVIAARSAVLGGNLVGTFAADALYGASAGGRILTMLSVVPAWVRLLFWPADLQADYGPDEIVAATGFGTAQLAGAAILIAAAVGAWAMRRRAPALSFGLGWIAVALVPVANVLVPTGIVLAERTLFLASVGAVLCAGALLTLIGPERSGRTVAGAVVLIILALGLAKSRARHTTWRDQETLLRQTVVDAPKSFAAHLAMSRFFEDSGSVAEAEAEYRKAVAIRPALVDQDRMLAEQYRLNGLCRPAVRLYRRALIMVPGDSAMRAALLACGDTATARSTP